MRDTGRNNAIGDSTIHSLIDAIRHWDDQEAWAVFEARYRPLIRVWCCAWWRRGRSCDSSEVDDAVQEVFAVLVRSICRYDPAKGRFRTWLRAVTEHVMIDLKRRRRIPLFSSSGLWQRLMSEEAREDPEKRLELAELLDRAYERVRGEVEPRTWAAYVETELRGRGIRQVADELGMRAGSVFQARYSVRQRLRHAIEVLGGLD